MLKIERVEPNNPQLCVETEYGYDAWGNKASATTRNCTNASGSGASGLATFTARTSSSNFTPGAGWNALTIAGKSVSIPAGAFAATATNALSQSEKRLVDPRFGALVKLEGPNQLTTENILDEWGRVVEEQRADGTSTKTQYCLIVGRASDTSSNGPGCGSTPPLSGRSDEIPVQAYSYTQVQGFLKNTSTITGPAQRVYKDREGRAIRQVTEAFDGGGGATAGRVIVQDTVYNLYGVATVTSGPYFLDSGSANVVGSNDRTLTRITVDALGRTTMVEQSTDALDPNGISTSIAAHNGGTYPGAIKVAVTRVAFNGLNTTTTNALLQQRVEEKNANGQLVRVTDAHGAQIAYQHDAFGNLLKTQDALQNLVTLSYDIRGRKLSMNDPDTGTWQYVYDAVGQLRAQQSPRQTLATRTTMDYDPLGRMTQRVEPEYTSTWAYDSCTKGVGKLCGTATTHGVAKTFNYDTLGRPSTSRVAVSGGPSFNTGVAYDGFGRVQTQTYPTGLQVSYDYTTRGFLNQVKSVQQLNIVADAKAGETAGASATWAAGKVIWAAGSVNARGQAENQTLGNGVNSRASFDGPTGRLKDLNAGLGSTNTAVAYTYTWDSIGNLKGRADLNGDGSTGNITDSYVYDALNRLTQYTVEASASASLKRTVDLHYNAIGNLLHKSDVGNYIYPDFGNSSGTTRPRPHALTTLNRVSGGSITYAYDASGNAITATDGAWRRITYTSFNLPSGTVDQAGAGGAEGPNGLRYLWYYDENHQRLKEVRTNAQGTRTTWNLHPDNQGGLGFETESTGSSVNLNRHYIAAGGQTLVVVTREALSAYAASTATTTRSLGTIAAIKVEYWHKDHLGSLVATTDHAGAVTKRYAYDPYGKRRQTNGTYDAFGALVIDWVDGSNQGTDRGYTGHEHLDDIGIIHMNGRLFDPLTGRFLQADPFIQQMDDLQNFNRYSYCFGNPLNCTDPTGYFSLRRLIKFVAVVVISYYLPGIVQSYLTTAAGGVSGTFVSFSAAGKASLTLVGKLAVAATTGFAAGTVQGGSLQSGIQGAFSAMLFAGVGQHVGMAGLDSAGAVVDGSKYAYAVMLHGVAGCISTVASGGKCGPGALSAAFSKAALPLSAGLGDGPERMLTHAVVGGTAATLGGGKFENGAMTGAFSYALNNCLYAKEACLRGLQTAYERIAVRYGPGATNIVRMAGEAEGVGTFGALRGAKSIYQSAVDAGEKINLHHPWPKYLGGTEVQDYVSLPQSIHTAYHRGLDEIYGRWLGGKSFEGLEAAQKNIILAEFEKYTQKFDAAVGTSILKGAYKNGFSTSSVVNQIPK
ncbi:hypothetical protein ASD88_20640 [Pelomonas sp. Root662]|nr:hypothetical protein ASC81_19990 [Pelomonas sp. Root405]KRA69612.1 hypothetical protein ASD88_20640 [Pelomonas sp. Root662]